MRAAGHDLVSTGLRGTARIEDILGCVGHFAIGFDFVAEPGTLDPRTPFACPNVHSRDPKRSTCRARRLLPWSRCQ